MPLTSNKQLIQRFITEVLNRQNPAAMDELVAEDFVEQVPFPGQGLGREGLRQTLAAFFAAFPDMRWQTHEQIAEGDTVVTRFSFTGTHRGEFLGVPPSGRPVDVWGVVIDKIRDGRMADSRIIMDVMGMLRQMGAG